MFRRLNLAVLLAALVTTTSSNGWAQEADARSQLLQQVHLGETLFRDDMVQSALDRLFRIDPDDSAALAAKVRLALRRGDLLQAQQTLAQLSQLAPNSSARRQADTSYRLATDPATIEALSKARLYAAAGRLPEARAEYDKAFRGTYPSADYTLEYWQFRARLPADHDLSVSQLASALEHYPKHAGLLTALARLALDDDEGDLALTYLHRLAAIPAGRTSAAALEFGYWSQKPVDRQTQLAWQGFANRYAGLPQAADAARKASHQAALINDPAWQAGREGIALIERGQDAAGALLRLQRAARAYPDDADILGNLGLAYSRTGDRTQALKYFKLAASHTHQIGGASAWVSLIDSTRYWLLLEDAATAVNRQQWKRAQSLFNQARQLDPSDETVWIDEADMNARRGYPEKALTGLFKALQLTPDSSGAMRGIQRVLLQMPPQQALLRMQKFPASRSSRWQGIRHALQVAQHTRQAEQAEASGHWDEAALQWAMVQRLDPDDPWASYHLSSVLSRQGKPVEAVMAAYDRHLTRHPDSPPSRYAQALLLASADQWQPALSALEHIHPQKWTQEMHALAQRVKTRQRIAHARQYHDAGNIQAAIAALETGPQTTEIRLQIAAWALENQDLPKAGMLYAAVLREDSQQADAFLGQLEVWAQKAQWLRVRSALSRLPQSLEHPDPAQSRQLADLWLALDSPARAEEILQASVGKDHDPLVSRDLGRIVSRRSAPEALQHYAQSMRGLGLLPASGVDDERNAVELTQATRQRAEDDWRMRGVRRETAALYQQQNPVLTVLEDASYRADGTPGLSRLGTSTTIARLEFPWRTGRVFAQADHVRMDAGTFDTDASGAHTEWFGSCRIEGEDSSGRSQSLPGCSTALHQTARGTSLGFGYEGDRWSWDVGHSPLGFPVGNWLGGLSYRGDLQQMGWRLTLSRRPIDSSILSFAGLRDPRTGALWGGVVATGPSLGLSWDQGEANGVWADISYHKLTGRHVEPNQRYRLMGGYYRRLINQPSQELSVGINAMYWHYQKDLGAYTLGQGGYYSPQRYVSVSLPVRYAYRSSDWSFVVDASVSRSWTKTQGGAYYPLSGLLADPLQAMAFKGVSAGNVLSASQTEDSTGGGFGYQLRFAAERRLSNHWVLGGLVDVQKSEDYSPNRLMLYLRYTFRPWQGDMAMPVSPISAYAQRK
ncbi:cellulose synthase complex outer membrane protein BcsC [Castellaniella sp.]|uniref:cellulose synthase complex outer membrane protein BcsC n=1 Tax=Castellaniella sp. TaxID=1955812 RepID=UPI003A9152DC